MIKREIHLPFIQDQHYKHTNYYHQSNTPEGDIEADYDNKLEGTFIEERKLISKKMAQTRIKNKRESIERYNRLGAHGDLSKLPHQTPVGSYIFIQSQSGNLGTKGNLQSKVEYEGGMMSQEDRIKVNEMLKKQVAELDAFRPEGMSEEDILTSQQQIQGEDSDPELTALTLLLNTISNISNSNSPKEISRISSEELRKSFALTKNLALNITRKEILTLIKKVQEIIITLQSIYLDNAESNRQRNIMGKSNFLKQDEIYDTVSKIYALLRIASVLNNYSLADQKTIFNDTIKIILNKKFGMRKVLRRKIRGQKKDKYSFENPNTPDILIDKIIERIKNIPPLSQKEQEEMEEYKLRLRKARKIPREVMRDYNAQQSGIQQFFQPPIPRPPIATPSTSASANIPTTPPASPTSSGQGKYRGSAIREHTQDNLQPIDESDDEEEERPKQTNYEAPLRGSHVQRYLLSDHRPRQVLYHQGRPRVVRLGQRQMY